MCDISKTSKTRALLLKLLVTTALFGLTLPVHAADMPIYKAAAPTNFFSGYPSGSGFYFGANGAMATGKANGVDATTAASNSGALVTQQGEVGLTVGYTWALSGQPVWWAIEGTFDFSNINGTTGSTAGGTLPAISVGGPADFTQIAILGAPWATVAALIPNFGNLSFPTLPALPTGVTASPGNIYLFLGTYEQDVSANFGLGSGQEWLVGLTTGVGTRWLLTNKTALDLRFEYRAPTQSTCVNNLMFQGCAGLGSAYMARTSVLF
jgi:hypothetical protein